MKALSYIHEATLRAGKAANSVLVSGYMRRKVGVLCDLHDMVNNRASLSLEQEDKLDQFVSELTLKRWGRRKELLEVAAWVNTCRG